MTSTMFLVILMVFAGGIAAAQAAINAQLSGYLENPIGASFISFLVGTIVLGLLLVFSKQKLPDMSNLANVPPRYLLGGICGCVFITTAIYLVPKIGVVNVLFLGLAGQMIVSLAIDNFGLFDIRQQPITMIKAAGILLILAGIVVLKSGFQPAKAQPRPNFESPDNRYGALTTKGTNRTHGMLSPHADITIQSNYRTARLFCKLKEHKVRRTYKALAKNMRLQQKDYKHKNLAHTACSYGMLIRHNSEVDSSANQQQNVYRIRFHSNNIALAKSDQQNLAAVQAFQPNQIAQ